MKTKLISLFLSCMLLLSLAACAKEDSGSDETTKETTAQTTEEIPTQTDTTGEETTESTAEKKLNTDVLSDLGLTYLQIAEKRGELIDCGMPIGGMAYVFENGFGYIWSPDDINWNPELKIGDPYPTPPKDENGNYDFNNFSLPNSQVKCYDMITSSVDSLLIGLTEPFHVSEIEKTYGITHTETGESGEYGNFCSVFSYEDKSIAVFTVKKGIIYPNSIATIKMK